MKIPSPRVFFDRLEALMEENPRLTGHFLFWALLVSVIGIGLFLGAIVLMLVLFVWGISAKAAVLMGTLTFALWFGSAIPFFMLRNRDQAYSRKLKGWMHGAHQGDSASQWKLVETYREGRHGLRRDGAQCGWWLKKLAERGDPKAMLELAEILEVGDGLLRDKVQARLWVDRAAEAEYPLAQRLQAERERGNQGSKGDSDPG